MIELSRMALEVEPLLTAINNSPQRERTSKRMEDYLAQSQAEMDKYTKLKSELYPDFKAGLIEQDEYESFRRQYDVKIAEVEARIIEIQTKMQEINTGISPDNDFVRTFKEVGEISTLTRSIVIAFIENIYVYEDNRIEINLKYRDDYETIVDYLYSAFYCKYYKQGANFCTRKRIKVSIISDAIIVALNQYLKFYVNFKDIMKASKEGQTKSCPKSSKIELENQLNELKEEKKDLYFQYKNECLTDKEYSAQRQAVDSKIVETQKAIDEIVSKQQESLEISENGFVSLFRKYKKFTKINSEILASFVKRITVNSSRNIEIEWKFKDELIELVNLAMEKGIELFFNEQDSFEIPPKGSYRNVF